MTGSFDTATFSKNDPGMNGSLSDGEARRRAATADDRNLVVTAGAGTGKTTLLVDRLVHLLLREPNPLPLSTIVALTFTNKAASELKLRLQDRLRTLVHGSPADEAVHCPGQVGRRERELAAKALQAMDTASIGTIHHFAARLLRLYPVECGVDPMFKEDPGPVFQAVFHREWSLWLDQEFGPEGRQHERWRRVFDHLSLRDVKEFVWALAGENVPLHEYCRSIRARALPSPLRIWLRSQGERVKELLAHHSSQRTLERLLDAARHVFDWLAEREEWDGRVPESLKWTARLNRSIPTRTKGWSEEDYQLAKRLVRVAQDLVRLQSSVLDHVVELALPFIEHCRRCVVREGYVSFDGLIVRARDVLRDHPRVRREMKAQFRAILVDEFQDTDPVQYEMILYLAEMTGREASSWDRVTLEPGKLFIVGDPKQSIYAFRRADMEAYDRVVHHHILGSEGSGERQVLSVNFRSHGKLLGVVNAMFARLFPPHGLEGIQPPFEPLQPAQTATPPLPDEGVELRLVRAANDRDASMETITDLEAEALARWLREEILGRAELREGKDSVCVEPRHIAIVFRKLSSVQPYLEALRRYEIPFLVEGERHFYERQEILDLVNLLRAVVRPHDAVALVGVLRSPLGGLHDREIELLARHRLLDYLARWPSVHDIARGIGAELAGALRRAIPVYRLLRELHECLPRVPSQDLFDVLLAKAPILEIAAASDDGERAVGNIKKFQTLAQEFMRDNQQSLHGLVEEMSRRIADRPSEGEATQTEAVLDENGEGAVQILSMHKAKGLEFPLVVLAGLHHQVSGRDSSMVHHDWSTNVLGLRFRQWQTLGGIYVGQKLEERQRAEQLRLLYVAMTRARRRVTLFSGVPKKVREDTFLALVLRGLGVELESLPDRCRLNVGGERVPVTILTPDKHDGRSTAQRVSTQPFPDVTIETDRFIDTWKARICRWEAARRIRRIESPTRYAAWGSDVSSEADRGTAKEAFSSERSALHPSRQDGDRARLIGVIAHRLLAEWDFQAASRALLARIETTCARVIPNEWQDACSDLVEELTEIFQAFLESEAYGMLRRATILGREVPLSMPWSPPRSGEADRSQGVFANGSTEGSRGFHDPVDGNQRPLAVEGVIDVIYRVDGDVWIGEYKTDRIEEERIRERIDRYRLQLAMYRQAVRQGLGIDQVGARLFFLRTGHTFTLE